MSTEKRSLLEMLFEEHRGALHSFFRQRIKNKPDASDLAQEVYTRMLRVPDADAIRNPEAYLFTVAGNLLREHYLSERRHVHHLNVDDLDVQEALTPMITPMDRDIDTQARLSMLGEVLQQLSPKCRAALMLQFHHGLSYREIGERLGVSTNMVKKYLAQGLSHCRKRMARLG